MSIRVETLGGLRIEVGGRAATNLPAQRLRCSLFVYLAVEGEATRDEITALLWPDRDPERGRHSLSQTLYELRRELGTDDWLHLQGTRLVAREPLWVDAREFEAAARRGDHTRAVDLFHGPFLDAVHLADTTAFESWIDRLRARLSRLHTNVRRQHVAELQERGDREGALASAQRWVELAPLDDDGQHALIELLAEAGRRSEALEQFESYRSLLERELDVEPLEHTAALVERIRTGGLDRAARARDASRPPGTVAVLHFETRSVEDHDRFLAEGIGEEISSRLSRLSTLTVTPAVPAPRAGAGARNARELGAELGVEAIVRGSVQRAGDTIRVSAQLVDARGDQTLWGEIYDRPAAEILDVQRDVARRIAHAVAAALGRERAHSPGAVGQGGVAIGTGYGEERLPGGSRGVARPELGEALAHLLPSSGTDSRLLDPLAHFQGRDAELAALADALDAARSGRGRLVTVSGPAGIGKSALLLRFAQGLDPREASVSEARCPSHGAAPLLPFTRLLRRVLGLDARGRGEGMADRAIEAISRLEPALVVDLGVHLHLLSLTDPRFPLPPGVGGRLLRRALHQSLVALLAAAARVHPLVVFLEDWHWADEASHAALLHLARVVESHRLLVVVTHRPELQPGRELPGRSVVLGPLGEPEAERLVEGVLEARSVPKELVTFLVETTGGNPFFMEEVCRTLEEDGTLSVSDDTVLLARPLDRRAVPSGVEVVLRSRIERLDRQAGEALRLAAVLGAEISYRLLLQVSRSPEALPAALRRLEASDLIRAFTRDDEPGLAFKHAITHEVARRALPRSEGRELHGITARAIEEMAGRENLEEHFEELAYHYARGGESEKAVHYLEAAGDKAVRAFALDEARKHYHDAIRLLDRAGRSDAHRVVLSFKWADAGMQAASEEQLHVLSESYRAALALGDRHLEARCLHWLGWIHYAMGNQLHAIERFRECKRVLAELEDERLLAQVYLNIGQSYAAATEYDEALRNLRRGIALNHALGAGDRSRGVAFAFGYLGMIYGEIGDFGAAHAELEKALRIVGSLERLALEGSVRVQRALTCSFQGDWEACIAEAARSRVIAGEIGSFYIEAMSDALGGYARFVQGNDGIEPLRKGVERLEASDAHLALSWSYACLAEALAAQEHLDEAEARARQALARVEVQDRLGEAAAHRVLARVAGARASGLDAGAAAHLEAAVAAAERKGSKRDLALARLCEGEILTGIGDVVAARAPLELARRSFEAMDMPWYARRAAECSRGAPEPAGSGGSA